VFRKEGSFAAVVGRHRRRLFHLLVGATLTVGTVVIGSLLTSSLTKQSWWAILGWLAAGIIVTFFYLRWQLRSQEESLQQENQREAGSALQAFIEQISHSDTYRELRTAPASGHKRAVQRAKMQTLLMQLNEERKGVLLSFLHGAKLSRKKEITPYEYTKEGSKAKGVERWKYPILRLNDIDFSLTKRTADTKLTFDDLRGIILRGAKLSKVNLSGANLSGADLSNADLSGAQLRKATPQDSERIPGESQNEYDKAVDKADKLPPGLLETALSGANLSGANLSGADLTGADLTSANLKGANLKGANLYRAEVTDEQLAATRSLQGATMPDGSKHD
jgi:uncharacterized protein YjbI with pentapeptide repeats